MNKFLYLLVIMMCLVIASCDDEHSVNIDDGGETETPFWENSHRVFAGLDGSVKRVTETTYTLAGEVEVEPVTLLDMSFNEAGRLTYYNATGMEAQTRSVWQTMAYYSYQYDDNGRMTKATVTSVGDEPVTYNLTYGEHTNYVPLIFPLGPMEFFLVKGLKTITSEDGTISYEYDGEKAAYTQAGWMGDTETQYVFAAGNPYPVKKVVTTSRDGEVLSEETTTYTYDAGGRLLKEDAKAMENTGDGLLETERTVTKYADGKFLLPVSTLKDMAGGFTFDWSYTYDSNSHLQQIDYFENKGTADEVVAKEVYEYLSKDNNGNWTDSKQLQSGLINWRHVDGLVGVSRQIFYW